MRKLTAIQKSARGEECTLRIPGVCNGNPETVVLCHAPYPGRSGMRTHDWWAAYGCSSCHDFADHRSGGEAFGTVLDRYWMPAIHETQFKLIEKGLISVGGHQKVLTFDYSGSKLLPRR